MLELSARSNDWSFVLRHPRKQYEAVLGQRKSVNQVEKIDPREQTPKVLTMRVIPVAGHDSMLLNLSGAHAPFFTRNIVLLTDNAGHVGLGEVPGGEKIRRVLEESQPLVVGQPLGRYNAVLNTM